jgi:type I restriction enzyme S subunit
MSTRLKTLANLVIDQSDQGELPYLALEHLVGGTGALEPQAELPIHRGGEQGSSAVRPGDVLFGKLRPYLAKTLLITEPAYASTELMALRPASSIESRYLAYLVGSRPLIEWATASSDGTKMPRTSWEKLGAFRIETVPPLSHQRAIADYLDTETTRIDALITKKQRMIELLKERRQASIRAATTRGLAWVLAARDGTENQNLAAPDHWTVAPLSTVCAFQSGKAHEPYIDADGDFICVNSRFISTEGETVKRCNINLSPARPLDVLMVMSDLPSGRALAKAFYVEDGRSYAVNQRVCIISSRGINPKYAYYQLDRNPGFLRYDDGTNQTHLSNSTFRKFMMFLPPPEEQLSIVEYLDSLTGTIRTALRALTFQIELLREHRQALITAAVTGEIEVPGVAA